MWSNKILHPPLKVTASLTGSKLPLICTFAHCFSKVSPFSWWMEKFYFLFLSARTLPSCQFQFSGISTPRARDKVPSSLYQENSEGNRRWEIMHNILLLPCMCTKVPLQNLAVLYSWNTEWTKILIRIFGWG